MKILDATCGARSIWYQKKHPFTTYMDIRNETINTIEPGNKAICQRKWKIEPDVVTDFRDTPFEDDTFDMIVFDPPHIIKAREVKPSLLMKRYGYFLESNYKSILREGIMELFRVLKPEGTFILKWNEISKPVDEILKLFPYKPLFGTRTGQRNNTHWIVFLKYRENASISDYTEGGAREQ